MKTVFDQSTTAQLVQRIMRLSSSYVPLWGKMTVYQMVHHCIKSERMYLGEESYKRLFIGRLFGRMALNSLMKDEAPMEKNQPTHPLFKMTGAGDLEPAKVQWVTLLERYPTTSSADYAGFVHPFFGHMTAEQVGRYVYKHTDHHLRQFDV
ncbi:MAG: DinB family protein [Bacteroidota bacterium]